MKVTVTPEGHVTVETDEIPQALAMIAALRNGTGKPKKQLRDPYDVAVTKKQPREPISESEPLPAALYGTWEWLVAHDAEGGVSTTQLAEAMEITKTAANVRLAQLATRGVAYRVRHGRYRAGEQ